MSKALEGVSAIMENMATRLRGYEVSVQSTFVYAFAKPVDAVNFCLRVQHGNFFLDFFFL